MPTDLQMVGATAAATGLALALLGWYIGHKGRYQGRFGAFALYAISFGVGAAAGNLVFLLWTPADLDPEPWGYFALSWLGTLSVVPTVAGLYWLLGATGHRPRWTLPLMVVSGTVMAIAWTSIAAASEVARQTLDPTEFRWYFLTTMAEFGLRNGAMFATVVVLASRTIGGRGSPDDGLIASALLLYPVSHSVGWVFDAIQVLRDPIIVTIGFMGIAWVVILVVLWLTAFRRSGRWADLAPALVAPGVALAIILIGPRALPGISAAGLARLLEVILLAVIISRGQFLGLDTRLRWGISKTTIAAIFVAAFFIASETAQVFFGGRFNDEYIGIAAAGALVFAIAPIMRMADRVAVSAVPLATGSEERFRQTLRVVAADGHISAEEENELGRLADELGLTAGQVLRLRREV